MVIAESARFLYGNQERDSDDEPRPRWWVAAAAAAALTVVSLPTLIERVAEWRDPLRKLKTIAATLPARPIEGRLADFEYAPFSPARAVRSAEHVIAIRAEAERLSEDAGQSAPLRHARGVALLLTGDARTAVRELSAATQLEPENPAFWNDLAAAQLARQRAADALSAANHALALSPSFAAAHFNRGLALEFLGSDPDAIRAYRRALALEPHARWSGEITEHLTRLRE